jgi:hypothetical protein
VEIGAACGIAGFLAVCLTDVVADPNRSNKESHSAIMARNAPWLQRRGGGAVTFLYPISLTQHGKHPTRPNGAIASKIYSQ